MADETTAGPGQVVEARASRGAAARFALGAELAVVFALSICFGVNFGFNYGVNNQVAYLLPSLRVLDSGLYQNDWFAMHCTHYHPAFKYLGALLIALNARGWGIAVALVVVVAAGMASTYWLMRELLGRRLAFAAFALLLATAFASQTRGPALSYVFDGILQPSTFGSAAFLGAVAFFVAGRYLASSLLLGLSGLFHANYLLLFGAGFGVAHLLLGTGELRRRLVRQFAVPAVIFALFLPMMISTASGGGAGAALGRQIYFEVRGPHHYIIANQERDFLPFVAWHLIGLGAALTLVRGSAARPARRLVALLVGLLLVIWVGVVGSAVYSIAQFTQLFTWRIAPHAELLLQALACAAAIRFATDPQRPRHFSPIALALVIGGVGLACFTYGIRKQTDQIELLLKVVLAAICAGLVPLVKHRALEGARAAVGRFWRSYAPFVLVAGCLALLYGAALPQLRQLDARSTLLHGLPPAEAELYAWMRRNTPKDAVFLTPPGIENMRYHGRRAIIVDWKSNPIIPLEVLEWYRRLGDVTARPQLRGAGDMVGYDLLDPQRLEALRARYRIDYVVVLRARAALLPNYQRVFENGAFTVLALAAPT